LPCQKTLENPISQGFFHVKNGNLPEMEKAVSAEAIFIDLQSFSI